jgi:protein-disulfide isomerase
MRRVPLIAALLLMAVTAAAQSPPSPPSSGFTTDQRREIVQILRDALKTDPSILRDAVTSLQADDQARDAAEQRTKLAANRQALTGDAADPMAGNPKGDVTLVEFYDPRCPYCRRMLPSIQALLQKDRGLRWVYKDIPVLGEASVMESRAILAAARQGAYLKMQDALMTNPAQPGPEMIRDTARRIGIDPDRLEADMKSTAVTQKISANLALSHDLRIDGTPVFIVGDEVIPGAVNQDALEAAISAARRKS